MRAIPARFAPFKCQKNQNTLYFGCLKGAKVECNWMESNAIKCNQMQSNAIEMQSNTHRINHEKTLEIRLIRWSFDWFNDHLIDSIDRKPNKTIKFDSLAANRTLIAFDWLPLALLLCLQMKHCVAPCLIILLKSNYNLGLRCSKLRMHLMICRIFENIAP